MSPEEKEIRDKSDEVFVDNLRNLVFITIFVIIFSNATYLISVPRYFSLAIVITVISTFLLMVSLGWKTRHVFFSDTKMNCWIKAILMTLIWGVFSYAVFMFSGLSNLALNKYLIRTFKADVAQYRNDPAGFPALKRLAKTNFDIDLALNDSDEAMEYSEKKSPASMDYGWNFCSLSINHNNIRADFNVLNKALESQWFKTIEMHEFGHCLDISRDFNYRVTGLTNHSIAPADRSEVKDFESLLAAEKKDSTKQWREIEADLIAFAYIELTYPNNAKELISTLIDKRDADQHKTPPDVAHNTSCWIKAARQAPLPENIRSVVEWADQLRNTANCKLSVAGR